MKPKPYLNLIGLAYRARKCMLGEEIILKGIKQKKIHLLLIANDCSEVTKKRLKDKCKTYQVTYMEADNRQILAQAIGKSERVAIGITDKGFAKSIEKGFHK